MSTNHTTNYDLNQWEGTDKILRTEFNADNTKIDAALKANADAIAATTAALSEKGNCSVEYQTYTGNGGSGAASPTTLTFSRQPLLLLICGFNSLLAASPHIDHLTVYTPRSGVSLSGLHIAWNGGQVSIYSDGTLSGGIDNAAVQMNRNSVAYVAVALFPENGGE